MQLQVFLRNDNIALQVRVIETKALGIVEMVGFGVSSRLLGVKIEPTERAVSLFVLIGGFADRGLVGDVQLDAFCFFPF